MDISIIIPIYNVEMYLKECLESLLNQDFTGKYEIVCVNDGSTDDSVVILKEYAKKYSNIVLVEQKNKGLSAARNSGFNHSKGKYIMFVDSDDYFKNDKVLSLLFREIEEYYLDFVIADFEYDYKNKIENRRKKRSNKIKNKVMSGRELYDLGIKTKSVMSVVWNKMYRKSFLERNGLNFYEGILHEDMEFTPRAYYMANRVKYIDEVVYMYRQREGSIMSSIDIKNLESYLVVANNLNHFNNKYNSDVIGNSELYMYVLVIRKLKYLKDKNDINTMRNKLKEINLIQKFLNSNRLKYKIFGLLYLFKFI